ncbi:hypothetical protein HK103_001536 [Boothiomyces macroporosus]|uniref:Uncharacterized protein n=1 Tax=Boothiomyces macroporosus TaxID=261099 RepID=A0AAD5UAG9_9FUNG|nr:hypothetical protein HK103_001536 [Boothiomyces macroporosus]
MAEGKLFDKLTNSWKLSKLKFHRALVKVKGIFKKSDSNKYKPVELEENRFVETVDAPPPFTNTLPRIAEEDESDIQSTATMTQEVSTVPSVAVSALPGSRRHSFANIFHRDSLPRTMDKRRSMIVTSDKYRGYRDSGRELRRHSLSRAEMEAIVCERRSKRVSLVQSMNGSDWEEVTPKLELDSATLKRNSRLKDDWC